MNRKIPLWLLLLVLFVGLNVLVLFGWAVRHSLMAPGMKDSLLGSIVLPIASYPSLIQEAFYELGILKFEMTEEHWADDGYKEEYQEEDQIHPPQLIRNEFTEIDGFKKQGAVQPGALSDTGYLLLSFWDPHRGQAVVQLMRILDQQVLHEWIPDLTQLSLRTNEFVKPIRYRMLHPLLLKDGGLVFSGASGSLVKISADSSLEWVLKGNFHHAKEQDVDRNLWVCGLKESDKFSRYEKMLHQKRYKDETIVKISPKGKILYEKSVTDILLENGYRGLLFGVQRYEPDLLHLNDVEPALYSTEFWNKGDLLVSLRHLSTVFLYRPGTNKIIWLKTGPWLNQHDVDFKGDSGLSVFGNDSIRDNTTDTFADGPIIGGHNNIYFFDFANEKFSTPYSTAMKRSDIRTPVEGLHQLLPNGDMFIEETVRGRLLRISNQRVIWEFTVRVNDDAVSLLSWSRYLGEDAVKNVLPILEKANKK